MMEGHSGWQGKPTARWELGWKEINQEVSRFQVEHECYILASVLCDSHLLRAYREIQLGSKVH